MLRFEPNKKKQSSAEDCFFCAICKSIDLVLNLVLFVTVREITSLDV